MPRMRGCSVLVVAILVSCVSCGGAAPPPPRPVPAATAPAPAAAAKAPVLGEPFVTDPGAEPRVRLRYHTPVGQHIAAEIEMTMATITAGTRFDVPRMRMFGAADIIAVDRDGSVTTRFIVERWEVDPSPSLDATQLAAMRSNLDSMNGAIITTRTDARGRTLDTHVDAAADVAEQLRGAMPQEGITALPDVPVGTGARWTTHVRAQKNGIEFAFVVDCHLVTLAGDRVALEGDIRIETADPIPVTGRGHFESAVDLATMVSDIEMDLGVIAGATPDQQVEFQIKTHYLGR